ncbi:MAG: ribosomal L7Ae/L30e/S12e/Gadd45 family protein [Firmicutes bacterium]|nr:ribosomal L7Ae/L30e/S12e/Gadd45 family protein [Bacillota bacterium]
MKHPDGQTPVHVEYSPQTERKIAGYLGIAQKAGKLAAGDMAAANALRQGRAFLLVLAADAGPQVKEELFSLLGDTPLIYWKNKSDLGKIVGKSHRGAAAVLDEGLAAAIRKAIDTA